MGTHPIFESDFDCLTDLHLFRESLSIQDKERKKKTFEED